MLTFGVAVALATMVPASASAKITFHVGHPRAYLKKSPFDPKRRDCYIAVPVSFRTPPRTEFGGYEHVWDIAPRPPLNYEGEPYLATFYGGLGDGRYRLKGERSLFSYGVRDEVAKRRKLMRFLAHRRWIRLTSKTRVAEHGKYRRISHRYSASALRHCRLQS